MPFNPSFEVPLEQGLHQYEVYTAAQATVEGYGFTLPPMPVVQGPSGWVPYNGQIPSDLTHTNDQELGNFMGLLSGLIDHVNRRVAMAAGEKRAADHEFELTSSKLRISHKFDENNKKRTETEIKDRTICDSRYITAQARADYCDNVYRLLSAIQKGVEQNFTAVSRRITQRGQDLERGRREGAVQSYTGAPTFRRSGQ
jgi:hypothetical protein